MTKIAAILGWLKGKNPTYLHPNKLNPFLRGGRLTGELIPLDWLIDFHSPSLSLFTESISGCPRYHRCKKTRGWKIQFKSHWKLQCVSGRPIWNPSEFSGIALDLIGLHLTPVDFIGRVDLFGSIPLHCCGFHEISIGFIGSLQIDLVWICSI